MPLTAYAQQHAPIASAWCTAKGVPKRKGVLRDETAGTTVQFSAVRVMATPRAITWSDCRY